MAYHTIKSNKMVLQRINGRFLGNLNLKTQKFSTNLRRILCQEQIVKEIDDKSTTQGSKYPEDWSKFGWKIKNETTCPELNLSSVVHLQHKYCNAQWLHMENPSDETNAFSVHFKTVPMDSTGVAHILEHVTLCGSQSFPVRDPFFKMLNRSLSTFMNAMTGPDYTLYPFATQNKQDFYNLMSVYLDAVFKPLLLKEDFLQEGWRLDLKDDSDKDLMLKGVVFNEMKGVFADSQQLFGRQLLSKLLPSHTYGICSGGLPEEIPNLSYEQLKEFHKTHYSPDNAKFYTYGNLSLEAHLEAASKYLPIESQEKSYVVPEVPAESRWNDPKRFDITCAVDPSCPAPNDSTLAVSYAACDIHEVYECFVLQVIGELLIDGPSAPFYKSLIESGLGSGFVPVSGYGAQTRDSIFTIGIQGMDRSNKEEVEKVIKDTFQEVSKNGFEKERVEAILHRTELGLKDSVHNFGLNLIMGLTPGWNHVSEPFQLLRIENTLQRFKHELSNDPCYLQKMVEKYFVNNSHHMVLTMTPKETYVEDNQKVLDEIEEKMVSSLSIDEKQSVITIGKTLLEKQSIKEDEGKVASLPSLSVEDIVECAPIYEIETHQFPNLVNAQISKQPTNGVSRFRALLNTDCIQNEPYYHWFVGLLTSMGAGEKHDFRQLETAINLCTGGLGASHHLSEHYSDLKQLRQGLLISSRCLEHNSEKMFGLWSDIFSHVFTNNNDETRARLSNLINMSATDSMNGVAYSGHHYAMSSAAAQLSEILPATKIREIEGGLESVRSVNKLALSIGSGNTQVLDEMLSDLSRMSKAVLNANNIQSISLNATESHMSESFIDQTRSFLQSLPDELGNNSYNKDQSLGKNYRSPSKTFIATPYPVHFCGVAIPTVPYENADSAPLRVLAKLVSAKFLHPEIREKGGAYGGGATSNPSSGVFSFYSYRDPNCQKTLDAFGESINWLLANNFSDRDIQEAKLGIFQAVDKPTLPSERGLRRWLSGITDEIFQEHRSRIRNVQREDLIRVANEYLKDGTTGITVIGPEATAKELDNTWNVEMLLG